MNNLLQLVVSQPSHLWLLGGLIFLGLGMIAGEPIVASLGIAAVITAIAALTVTSVSSQLIIWGVLSVALAVMLKGLVPKRAKTLSPALEARVTELIPKGGVGWVLYEGALWRARCQISDIAIPPEATVHVVDRQGLTLIVLPTDFLDSPIDLY